MFPQFKRIDNESGIVLFIVLMVAIIIMVFSAGMLTQSMNEINYAQQQIDQITADQLAKGIFWNEYAPNSSITTSLGHQLLTFQNEDGGLSEVGRNYQTSMFPDSTINGITSYNVITSYDTF